MRSIIPGIGIFDLVIWCIGIKLMSNFIIEMCKKTCPYCKEKYNEGATKCPHCQSDLSDMQKIESDLSKKRDKPSPLMPGQIEWEKNHPEERIAREKREAEERAKAKDKE